MLTRRHFEILSHNRLTLAILVGCPLAVILMFAVLFRAGAFEYSHPNPSATVNALFWVAFGAFFFGLTYGLLEISTEMPIFRRERLVNLKTLPYVFSKIAVLLPVLAVVLAVELLVLRFSGRLPAAGLDVFGPMFITVLIDGCSAMAMGLLASAAVSDPIQATLALPMLTFPQVLFSGGMLAVPVMAQAGKAISLFMSVRWAFEAVGHSLNVADLYARGSSPLGPPLLAEYGDSFARAVWQDWLIMAAFTAVLLAGCCWVLARKSAARA